MKPSLKVLQFFALFAVFVFTPKGATNPPSLGDNLTACLVCHDHDGNSTNSQVPRLAGQNAKYLENQLKAFRDHLRSEADSQSPFEHAPRLSDPEIAELAEHFSHVAPTPNEMSKAHDVSPAKKIFLRGLPEKKIPICAQCHGINAAGFKSNPRLAGQNSAYLINQFKNYEKQSRSKGSVMVEISRQLSEEERTALALFLESL